MDILGRRNWVLDAFRSLRGCGLEAVDLSRRMIDAAECRCGLSWTIEVGNRRDFPVARGI